VIASLHAATGATMGVGVRSRAAAALLGVSTLLVIGFRIVTSRIGVSRSAAGCSWWF
jgi:hypothetical protein